jgi:hypothetical protein
LTFTNLRLSCGRIKALCGTRIAIVNRLPRCAQNCQRIQENPSVMLPTDVIFIIARLVYLSDLSTWQRVCWTWKSISAGEVKRRITIALLSNKIHLALQARGNRRKAEFAQVQFIDHVPLFECKRGSVEVNAVTDVDMISLTVPDLSGDDLSDESFYFIYGPNPGAQIRGQRTSDSRWELTHLKLHTICAIRSDPEYRTLNPSGNQFRPLPRFEEFAFRLYIVGGEWSCHYRDGLPWWISQIMLLQLNGPGPPHVQQINGERMEWLHTDFGFGPPFSDRETCSSGSTENWDEKGGD